MRRSQPLWLATAFAFLTAVVLGCGGSSTAPPPPTTKDSSDHKHDDHDDHKDHKDHDDDDDHHKEGMMVAHVGKHHAYLSAHLSKEGNELDLLFETIGKDPKPLALAVAKIAGTARKPGEEKEQELVFEPAPAAERPKGEKEGTASRFVARAPWLNADETYVITAEVEVDGRKRRVTWKNFIPKKFSHHEHDHDHDHKHDKK